MEVISKKWTGSEAILDSGVSNVSGDAEYNAESRWEEGPFIAEAGVGVLPA